MCKMQIVSVARGSFLGAPSENLAQDPGRSGLALHPLQLHYNYEFGISQLCVLWS